MTSPTPTPAVAAAAERLSAFGEAVRTAAQQITQQITAMHTAMKPLIDYYEQHPELFQQLGPAREACHCLCARHPARRDVCSGDAEPGLTIAFASHRLGVTNVRVCQNCYDAHLDRPARPSRPEIGTLEAVTATCTCHCWKNHPDQKGVCEAASQSGTTVDGKPACGGCWRATRPA
ncbi:hypothetical protein [Streptomyces sp. NPDC093269]|uniref:hypothetical protein n=1 Tax=Streptomyces sp. NPDC093269 TaxID=3366038 RepID=UPI0037F5F0C4